MKELCGQSTRLWRVDSIDRRSARDGGEGDGDADRNSMVSADIYRVEAYILFNI